MGKKLILHDLPAEDAKKLFPANGGEYTIFSARPPVQTCVGCLHCWFKTPGRCAIDDRGKEFSPLIHVHEELTVISRLVFGELSPDTKAVLDRSIGHVSPFFRVVEGEMHHRKRYKNVFRLRYIFYGPDMTESDKENARALTRANALNLGAQGHVCSFYSSVDAIEAAL